MCKVDNRRKMDTLGEWCVVSKSKWIKVLGIVRLESGFFFHLGDFLPFPSDCQELMMFHMSMNAPSAAHCLWLWTEQEVFITRAGPKFGSPVEIFNFFLIERVETLQLSDMTLQKWWADSPEVFPGQSVTNSYFAFQVLAYKHSKTLASQRIHFWEKRKIKYTADKGRDDMLEQGDGILPLYSALVKPHLQGWVQFWASQYKRDMNIPERVHQMATEII